MKHILTIALINCCFTMIYAQNLGVKLADGTTPNTTLDVNGSIAFREGTALSLSNGVNSNVILGDYTVFRITGPTADFSITGCTGGVDGRVLTIINSTAYNLTIANESTSLAANQINAGGSNITLAANGVATLVYNSTLTKWIVSGIVGSAPKFSGITNGNLSDSMLVVNNGVPAKVRPVDFIENYAWGIDGNSNTTAGTNFLGTTNAQDVVFKSNNTEGGRFTTSGNLGLGQTTTTAKLDILGANALSTGIGLKLDNTSLDSVLVVANDANLKFRNTTYDFGTDPNNFLSGHYLSSAGFRSFTPSYGRGFFGVESLLASGGTSAGTNYYGFRSNITEESGHSTALNETYSGTHVSLIFPREKKNCRNVADGSRKNR